MLKFFKFFIYFIFIYFIITLGSSVSANTVNSIVMDVYIDSNGDANVSEKWDCDSAWVFDKNKEHSEYIHEYVNLGASKITNLSVSMNGIPFTTVSKWDPHANFNNKAYKTGIDEESGVTSICFGVSEYGTNSYELNYTITNFVSNVTDGQMVNVIFFNNYFPDILNNLAINISSDYFFSDDTKIYNLGNQNMRYFIDDGIIKFRLINPIEHKEYINILMHLPEGTFEATNYYPNDFEYYYNEATERPNKMAKILLTGICVTVVFAIIYYTFLTIRIKRSKYEREESRLHFKNKGNKLPKLKDISYYRDIPCNNDLFLIYFIAYEFFIIRRKTDILGSILLKWLRDKKIDIKKTDATNIVFYQDKLDTFDNQFEKELYNMFLLASIDGVLEQNEFNKWCIKNYAKILNWFSNLLNTEKDKLIKDGLLFKKHIFLCFGTSYVVTPELRQMALNIAGLKRYLIDYTSIADKEAPHVMLLEEYLILAEMFKITTNIEKDFKNLYPNIISSVYLYKYSNASKIEDYTNSGIKSAISSQKKQKKKI